MAAGKKDLKTKHSRTKSKRSPRKKPRRAASRSEERTEETAQTPAKQLQQAPLADIDEEEGKIRLREAANRAIAEKSQGLVDKLVEKAGNGNLASAKMLVDFLGGMKDAGKRRKKHQVLTLLDFFENEPEWNESKDQSKTQQRAE
jgi:hypothetical protein